MYKIHNNKKNDMIIEINRRIVLTNNDIDDIMCTALEGDITSMWCGCVEVIEPEYYGEYAHEQISRGGSLRFYDAESSYKWELDKDKFIGGFINACEDGWLNNAFDGCGIDTSRIDAVIADIVVQYALFREILFG